MLLTCRAGGVLPTISQRTRLSLSPAKGWILAGCGREHGAVGARSCQRFCPTRKLFARSSYGTRSSSWCALRNYLRPFPPQLLSWRKNEAINNTIVVIVATHTIKSLYNFCITARGCDKKGCYGEIMRTEAGFCVIIRLKDHILDQIWLTKKGSLGFDMFV